jgi:drug/metabolite transporter (DMT)-like permease
MIRDHLKLQIIVILWGFTAVLGELISLSATNLVAWRCGIAGLCLLIWLRKRIAVPPRQALLFLATGFVIGAHWITFFLSVKIAKVSICMIGVATLALWTAILEPLLLRNRRFRIIDLFFGSLTVVGVVIIYISELEYSHGLFVAIFSAFLAAAFSVINAFHIKHAAHTVIVFYEMVGATFFAAVAAVIMNGHLSLPADSSDWLWILVLTLFCTVVSFSQYVQLLERMSVFTLNFVANLEPVYGITLAAIILQEHKNLNSGFYLGATVIIGTIVAYPLVRRRLSRKTPPDQLMH